MRHKISGRKLNRTSSHRKALFKNLAQALIRHEQITTTLPKAKDLRPVVEKMVTLAKRSDSHARVQLIDALQDKILADRLISEIAPRFSNRNGGYTRVIKAGFRYGDNSPMAIIEFVDAELNVDSGKDVEKESSVNISESK